MGVQESVSRRLTIIGVVQVLFGCIIGLTPPTAVVHFRSLITSHLEFTANGTLQAVLGLLVPQMKLGQATLIILEVLINLGTWTNGAAFVYQAFTGIGTPLSPIMNAAYPPKEISTSAPTHISLLICAPTIIISLAIAVVGLVRGSGPIKKKSS